MTNVGRFNNNFIKSEQDLNNIAWISHDATLFSECAKISIVVWNAYRENYRNHAHDSFIYMYVSIYMLDRNLCQLSGETPRIYTNANSRCIIRRSLHHKHIRHTSVVILPNRFGKHDICINNALLLRVWFYVRHAHQLHALVICHVSFSRCAFLFAPNRNAGTLTNFASILWQFGRTSRVNKYCKLVRSKNKTHPLYNTS